MCITENQLIRVDFSLSANIKNAWILEDVRDLQKEKVDN
jgi:hypothetical protein